MMYITRRMRYCKRNQLLKSLFVSGIFIFFIIFIVVPLFFHFSTNTQINAVFSNIGPDDIGEPYKKVDFGNPHTVGLFGTRNFYIQSDSANNVKLGVWHILPENLIKSVPDNEDPNYEQYFDKSLSNGQSIFVYLHGNTPSRATYYRMEMYQVLRKLNFHIIAFDYRGFADSTSVLPSENGLVTDAKAVIQYAQSFSSQVFVWGHSLGTGVAIHAVAELCSDDECPSGLILQAAFNTLYDEIRNHPLLKIYNVLPIFDWIFIEPYRKKGIKFNSEVNIDDVMSPILQLHARDDVTVPYYLGYKLYQHSLKRRSKSNMGPHRFVDFDEEKLYGHNFISRAPELPEIIREFSLDALNWWKQKKSLGYDKLKP